MRIAITSNSRNDTLVLFVDGLSTYINLVYEFYMYFNATVISL